MGYAICTNMFKYMYLELICSNSGVGGMLMAEVENLTLKLGMDVVSLKAMRNVISWYASRHNYKHLPPSKVRLPGRKSPKEKRVGDIEYGWRMSKKLFGITEVKGDKENERE